MILLYPSHLVQMDLVGLVNLPIMESRVEEVNLPMMENQEEEVNLPMMENQEEEEEVNLQYH
jgi:hypothetical protein